MKRVKLVVFGENEQICFAGILPISEVDYYTKIAHDMGFSFASELVQ